MGEDISASRHTLQEEERKKKETKRFNRGGRLVNFKQETLLKEREAERKKSERDEKKLM